MFLLKLTRRKIINEGPQLVEDVTYTLEDILYPTTIETIKYNGWYKN